MFGFQGGESSDVVARKKGLHGRRPEEMALLTRFDCTTTKSPGQLAAMVKTRPGISEDQSQRAIDTWMRGKSV